VPPHVPPLIELIEVSRAYAMGAAHLTALDRVSLRIETGEMVAIMGASGSGKSTLLHILGTLDRPSAGRYLLDGEPVESLDEEARARLRNAKIGFVFQAFNLLPRLSALENVELPMSYAGVPSTARRRRALAALDRVGLADRVQHRPVELSGGQQQRVAIARAIVNAPRLLLADEPTGALDTATTAEVMTLFGQLHRDGMAIALVTHDPTIGAYAPRTLTVRDGVIVADRLSGARTGPAAGGAGPHPSIRATKT
jgi:putative ABC transport system ATP-binding protein